MKTLAFNDSGAWKNVLQFREVCHATVRAYAECLARLSYPVPKIRITDADSGKVLEYWTIDRGWYKPMVAA